MPEKYRKRNKPRYWPKGVSNRLAGLNWIYNHTYTIKDTSGLVIDRLTKFSFSILQSFILGHFCRFFTVEHTEGTSKLKNSLANMAQNWEKWKN